VCSGGGEKFAKKIRNTSNICLFVFLLSFYDSGKYLRWGVQTPLGTVFIHIQRIYNQNKSKKKKCLILYHPEYFKINHFKTEPNA